MADLTEALPGLTAAKGISAAASGGGASTATDALAGLTSLTKNLISIGRQNENDAWNNEVRQHTREDWAYQGQERDRTEQARAVDNEAATDLWNTQKGLSGNLDSPDTVPSAKPLPAAMGGSDPAPIDSALSGGPDYVPPSDVTAAAGNLNNAQKAINQGRGSQEQFDMQMEQTYDNLMRKYPDQAAHIAAYFTSRGLDHYMFRNILNNATSEQNEFDAQQDQMKFYRNAAAKAGVALPTMTDGQLIEAGRQVVYAQDQAKIAQERATALQTATRFNWDVQDHDRIAASRASTNAALVQTDTVINPFMIQLNNLVNAGGADVQGTLNKITPQIGTAFQTLETNTVARMHAQGADPKDIDTVVNGLRQKRDAMLAYFDPKNPVSYMAVQQRTLDAMQTQFGINAAQALPKYMELSKALGPQGAAMLFNGNPATQLDPKTLQGLKEEFNGWQVGSPDGMVHMNNIIAGLQGRLKLQNVQPGHQVEFIKGQLAGTRGNAHDLASGNVNDTTKSGFYNGYDNVLNAATTVKPGAPLATIQAATDAVTGGNVVGAMNALRGDTLHDNTVMASRGAAATLLETAKMSGPSQTQYQHLFFNDRTGKVDIGFDQARWQRDQANNPSSGGGSRSMNMGFAPGSTAQTLQQAATADPVLAQKRDIMNKNLDHLVATMGDDKNLLKMSPKQYAKALYEGAPTDKPVTAGPDAKQGLQTATDKFVHDLTNLTPDLSSGPDNAGATANREALKARLAGNPRDAAIRTILGEAGGESDEGQQAVASTIVNRSSGSQDNYVSTVTAPNQYETWDRAAGRNMNISPDSAAYKRADANLRAAEANPSKYSKFYAPHLQHALGRANPSWDNGHGVAIGNHLFFE